MCLYPVKLYIKPRGGSPGQRRGVTVSCGKCLECLQQKSTEWAFRICHEASQYVDNSFITLTYNNDFLPLDGSVSRREVQLFMKRLRKALSPLRVRFFACGEYGSKMGRPHYHIIIFGWFPYDAYFWGQEKNDILYRSPFLEKIWTKGFSSVGHVSFNTALYCAKYMNKWQYDHSDKSKAPPFIQMSNRPGIGYNSVYSGSFETDRFYLNGHYIKTPRYYLDVMERDGIFLEQLRNNRALVAEHVSRVIDLHLKRDKFYKRFLSCKVVVRPKK